MFEVGDTVKLKGFARKMTVIFMDKGERKPYTTELTQPVATCAWYDNEGHLETVGVDPAALVHAK